MFFWFRLINFNPEILEPYPGPQEAKPGLHSHLFCDSSFFWKGQLGSGASRCVRRKTSRS